MSSSPTTPRTLGAATPDTRPRRKAHRSARPAYCLECGVYFAGGMIARSIGYPHLCVECEMDGNPEDVTHV